jgi:hypothetical protein
VIKEFTKNSLDSSTPKSNDGHMCAHLTSLYLYLTDGCALYSMSMSFLNSVESNLRLPFQGPASMTFLIEAEAGLLSSVILNLDACQVRVLCSYMREACVLSPMNHTIMMMITIMIIAAEIV